MYYTFCLAGTYFLVLVLFNIAEFQGFQALPPNLREQTLHNINVAIPLNFQNGYVLKV